MADQIINVRICDRCDTESNWIKTDPILLNGEVAISSDKNNMHKVGNGFSKWSELSYAKAKIEKSDVEQLGVPTEEEMNSKVDKLNPTASGTVSFGRKANTNIGEKSVTLGTEATASGEYSIAVGMSSQATSDSSIAIGRENISSGDKSISIGTANKAIGDMSLALGTHNTASNEYATATGCWTTAAGIASTASGNAAVSNGWTSMSSGLITTSRGLAQHVFGSYNIPDTKVTDNELSEDYSLKGEYLVIVGNGDALSDDGKQSNAHTLDWGGNAWFSGDVYTGSDSGTNMDAGSEKLVTMSEVKDYVKGIALGDGSAVDTTEIEEKIATINDILETKMNMTNPTGSGSVSIGRKEDSTIGNRSIVLGSDTIASGKDSIAIGRKGKATGSYAASIGYNNTVSGDNAVAIGVNSTASSGNAVAIGSGSSATGWNSVAIGAQNNATNTSALSSGYCTEANGNFSFSTNYMTSASGGAQTVIGSLNIPDESPSDNSQKSKNLFIVGNGDIDDENPTRSNAHTVDWDGNGWFAGDVYVGSSSGINKDDGSKRLLPEDELFTEYKKTSNTVSLDLSKIDINTEDYYKISDATPLIDDFRKGFSITVYKVEENTEVTTTFNEGDSEIEEILLLTDDESTLLVSLVVAVCYSPNENFNSTGTYVLYAPNFFGGYVTSLAIPSYDFIVEEKAVIKEKYFSFLTGGTNNEDIYSDTISWIGIPSDVIIGDYYYRVPVEVKTPALSDFANGATFTASSIIDPSDQTSVTLEESNFSLYEEGGIKYISAGLFLLLLTDCTIEEQNYKAGLYSYAMKEARVTITIPGVELFKTGEKEVVDDTQIKEEYLPIFEPESTPDTLVWDGDTTGRTCVTIIDALDEEGNYVKMKHVHVSDVVLTKDEVSDKKVFYANSNDTEQSETCFTYDADDGNVSLALGFVAFCAPYDNYYDAGRYYPKKGIYFYYWNQNGEETYTASVTINGFTKFGQRKIKQAYLPEEREGINIFEDYSNTLSWNYDTRNRYCVGEKYYLISSDVPSLSSVQKGYSIDHSDWNMTITEDNITNDASNLYVDSSTSGVISLFSGKILIIRQKDVTYSDLVFEKRGIYFKYEITSGLHDAMKSLTLLDYEFDKNRKLKTSYVSNPIETTMYQATGDYLYKGSLIKITKSELFNSLNGIIYIVVEKSNGSCQLCAPINISMQNSSSSSEDYASVTVRLNDGTFKTYYTAEYSA